MAYKIRSTKLDFLIRAYNRGEEVSMNTVRMLTGITTPQVIKSYYDEFLKWKDSIESTDQMSTENLELPSETIMSDTETLESEELIETPSVDEVKPKKKVQFVNKSQVPNFQDYIVKIENENGIEGVEEFEVSAISPNAKLILVKELKPILKDIMINGSVISVDLRKLNKMSPDDKINGVSVSTLLIAATIA